MLISHSQGGLFSNSAYQDLSEKASDAIGNSTKTFDSYAGLYRNLQVGTPTSHVKMPGSHLTNAFDIILQVPGSLRPNSTFFFPPLTRDPRTFFERQKNHAFIDTYLNPSPFFLPLRNTFINKVISEAEQMRSNCGSPPIADFTFKSRSFASQTADPMTFDFDASLSKDDDIPVVEEFVIEPPDYDIKEFNWTIDETIKLEGIKTSHEFLTEGPHVVELIVTDLAGNESEPLRMLVNVINQAPTPAIEIKNDKLTVTFDASKSTDDGKIVEYRWKINGETFSSSGPTKTYQFLNPGRYLYELELIDNNGKSSVHFDFVNVGSGCSQLEYSMGLCPCSKPFLTWDPLISRIAYTCEAQEPLIDQYAEYPEHGINGTVSGDISFGECSMASGYPEFNFTGQIRGPAGLYIVSSCIDGSNFRPGGLVGGIIDASGILDQSGKYSPNGSCYKWVVYAIDVVTVRYKQEITAPGQYPYCR